MLSPMPRPPPVTSALPQASWPRPIAVRATPGSRATTGRRDPCRARARARRGARSSRERVFGSASTQRIRSGLNALPSDVGHRVRDDARRPAPRPAWRRRRSTRPRPSPRAGRRSRPPRRRCRSPIAADSSSAGPMRLPAMFSVSSLRPCRIPVAVLVDRRPVAVRPDAGEARASTSRGSARRRPRRRASSPATAGGRRARRPAPRTGCARSSRRRPCPGRAPGSRARPA